MLKNVSSLGLQKVKLEQADPIKFKLIQTQFKLELHTRDDTLKQCFSPKLQYI